MSAALPPNHEEEDRLIWAILLLVLVVLAASGCGPSPAELRIADPCYSLTIDTTFTPHDSTYTWMGVGGCDTLEDR